MDKKRLDEIRETLSNGDHLTRLDRDDLLAMIAAALAGPSDEAVSDAIKVAIGIYKYAFEDTKYNPDGTCSWIEGQAEKLIDILRSLQKYQRPTNEAVQRAIGSLESDCEYGEQQEQHKVAVDVFDLRVCLTAIRQVRTEPCEWCKPSDRAGYEGVKLLDFIVFRESDGWDEYESMLPKNYCPNCGRKLEG